MSTERFDPVQYKLEQIRVWDAAAYGWNKWWAIFENSAQALSDRMLELAGIESGHRVLDIATGSGEPAATAARRVGPSGRITAIDQSTNMLDIARERMTVLGLQNIEFLEMDSEVLDFPEESFDAVVCRWGLMFLPDLKGTLGKVRRLLKAEGKFATAVVAGPEEVPFLSMPMGVVGRLIDVPPPPPSGTPGIFSLADTAALERAFSDAGFAGVRSERMTVSFNFSSPEEYVHYMKDTSLLVNALLADKPTALQREVWEAIGNAAGEFAVTGGGISLPEQCILVVGQRG